MSGSHLFQPTVRIVIPARFASSRLPGKPLVDLGGLPMIVRVHQRVKAALPNADVIVAIDDGRVGDVLKAADIPFLMTSTTHESGTDRTEEVAARCGWADSDTVINVQGDEPLVPVRLLQAFTRFCSDHPTLFMATIAVPIDSIVQLRDPNVVKVMLDSFSNAIVFSRSPVPYCRDVPEADWPVARFLRHVGIYAYRRSVLRTVTSSPVCDLERFEKLEQLRALWLGMEIRVMPWPDMPPHGVDTPEDAERVSRLIREGRDS